MAAAIDMEFVQRHPSELILAQDVNFYGDKIVTATADHRMKVWIERDEAWELLDSWRPHNAEITDVKWNGPLNGTFLGSISEDGNFKLWQEDAAQAPKSGRRFKCIMSLASKTRLPWVSLDFKNVGTDTFLALITYDGNFTILEPRNHENLAGEWSDWMEGQDFWACDPIPHRSEETAFKVVFHQDALPCYTALAAGLDSKALSIAVSVMNTIKIYRSNGQKQLHLAAELTGATDLVRDVAWAEGSVRGFDLLATASKDEHVRVYEIHTYAAEEQDVQPGRRGSLRSVDDRRQSVSKPKAKVPSGIGAKLAGITRTDSHGGPVVPTGPGRLRHQVKLVDTIYEGGAEEDTLAMWRVQFDDDGNILSSSGDDDLVRSYRRGLDGKWNECADVELRQLPTA